jgi:hypothetical protein
MKKATAYILANADMQPDPSHASVNLGVKEIASHLTKNWKKNDFYQ